MLYLWLAIAIAFIALGLIIGRIESRISLRKRQENQERKRLRFKTYKAVRCKN